MKIKKTDYPCLKREDMKKESVPRSQFYQWLVTSVLTVIVAVITICMTLYQINLSQMQTSLNQVFSHITYQVFESEQKFQYHFAGVDLEKGYPCIRFTNGRPKDVAVIIYNSQNNKMIVTSSAIQTTDEIIIENIKTEMPRNEYSVDANYAYDYFFLYFTDSSNTPYLNMIYYQIDLKKGEVSNALIASEADLLLLGNHQLDQYKREMLEDYKTVLTRLREINSLV